MAALPAAAVQVAEEEVESIGHGDWGLFVDWAQGRFGWCRLTDEQKRGVGGRSRLGSRICISGTGAAEWFVEVRQVVVFEYRDSLFGRRWVNNKLVRGLERIQSLAGFEPVPHSAGIAGIAGIPDDGVGRWESVYLESFSCRSVRPLFDGGVELSRNSRQRCFQG